MPKPAKIAALCVLGLIALFGAIYGYLRWNDYNALRTMIAARIERATGQQITFNGPISLKMGSDSFLEFQDVVLTNPDWAFVRSTITVDEGQIGLNVPTVVSGGIGTLVKLNRVNVKLERPDDAPPLPEPLPPGTPLSAPGAPPLPKFDELRANFLTVEGQPVLGNRVLKLQDFTVVPETPQRTVVTAQAQDASDISLSVVTDEITDGRSWRITLTSPRSDTQASLDAVSGRKLYLNAVLQGDALDLGDVRTVLPTAESANAPKSASAPFVPPSADLPIGWLQLITATFDVRLKTLADGDVFLRDIRADGRADGGWMGLAPIEAFGGDGAVRGFGVLDATVLPARAEVSFDMEDFAPFVATRSVIDGAISLSSEGDTLKGLGAMSGRLRMFIAGISLDGKGYDGALAPMLEALEIGPDFDPQCAFVSATLKDSAAQRLNGTIRGGGGSLHVRGAIDIFDGPLDLGVAVRPKGEDPQFYKAAGSFEAPTMETVAQSVAWSEALDDAAAATCTKLRQSAVQAKTGR